MLNLVANGSSGYNINNSLRFRASASAYLSRTPASAGNRQIFTVSTWVKRGTLGVDQKIFSAYGGTSDDSGVFDVRFSSADVLYIGDWNTGLTTTAVFRDPSAWYHIVIAVDTTQATGTNRIKAYVNGVQYTLSGTAFVQNVTTPWNNSVAQNIGRNATASNTYFDGYMAEFYNIDGQAITPSSFGNYNSTTGVWQPAKYTGTYGTNGFYLNFSNIALTSGSNTGLGQDFSGNGNYWNTNNISVTAGNTYDAMTDVPTLTSATVANYATLNPLRYIATATTSNANLDVALTGSLASIASSIAMSSGKWYCEFIRNSVSSGTGAMDYGVVSADIATPNCEAVGAVGYYNITGNKYVSGVSTAYGASYGTSDLIGIALDCDSGTVTFYKNNTSQGAITLPSGYSNWQFAMTCGTSAGTLGISANFGQRPFTYTPPTGFLALNTFNLPTSTIVKGNKYMDATTYTGNGTNAPNALTVTNAGGFKPDLVWIKIRSGADIHNLQDSVRTLAYRLSSNNTNNDSATGGGDVSSLNSNGFTISYNNNWTNANGSTYVGWQWQAGQGSTSSNTNGSITSTVSVNATAGFSIVTYTGTGTAGTIGHGLGVAPAFTIFKNRTSGTPNWVSYHKSLGATKGIYLNLTNAAATDSVWQNTSPTSSVISIAGSASANVNTNGNNYVCYAWAEIAGFSSFGSYTGNGSTDGPFIYTGFRPKYVLIKVSSTTEDWYIWDTSRGTYNANTPILYADLSAAESTSAIDTLSNGFKCRTAQALQNSSGATYIYAAFAENPFKNSNAR